MVILKKDFETKEIEIQGFRKILKDPKHPDYRELKVYIKKGWIPVDTEDDEKEIEKAKRRKKVAKDNKARRPKYVEMEKNIQKLIENNKIDKKELENFETIKKLKKNNYKNVLNWYNDLMKNILSDTQNTSKKDIKEVKNDQK